MEKSDKCPYCGSKEMVTGIQYGTSQVVKSYLSILGSPLTYIICKECGTVVRVVAERPHNLKNVN